MRILARTCVCSLAVLLAGSPTATAQSSTRMDKEPSASESTIAALQRRVDELAQQLALLEQQLAELREHEQAEQQRSEAVRLRQAAAAAAAAAAPVQAPDTATKFVSGTRMQPQLNPEISVTGNMFAIAGDREKERFSPGEWELDVQSYLDPYSKLHVVLAKPEDESLELEEGYVSWLNLPGHLTLTVGKKRQQFGVLNRWHPHAYDQVDTPWVLEESFGAEGLKGTGLSLDWLMPRLWADANELTLEVMNGDNEVAFAGEDWQRPSLLARLKSYWDLSDDAYLEVGVNGLQGRADPEGRLDHRFLAVDLTYNWYPAGRELYRDLTIRGMLLRSSLDVAGADTRDAWGGYVYGQYKLSSRWIAGLRYDSVEDQRVAGHRRWGFSPYLTFWQSEFVRLRGQASYQDDNEAGIDRRFVLQLTVAAGPHKHDSY